MSKLSRLLDIDFPDTPFRIAKNDRIRTHLVKSTAYITYCIKSININQDMNKESELAALTTGTYHNIEDGLHPNKYLLRSIIEIEEAIEKIEDLDDEFTEFKRKLENVKSELDKVRPIDN